MDLGRTRRARRALASMELAIVLPLLLILTLGLLEYGWLFLKVHQITNASRQGARIGARAGAIAGDINQAVADAMAAGGLGGSGYQLTITPADPGGLQAGEMLTVEVSVTYADIDLGVPLVPTPETLESVVTMVREGPSD